jgi:hypothetical protein
MLFPLPFSVVSSAPLYPMAGFLYFLGAVLLYIPTDALQQFYGTGLGLQLPVHVTCSCA